MFFFSAMMADADGKEDQPTSTVPRIIAFDLDDTLWHPEMVRGAGGSEDLDSRDSTHTHTHTHTHRLTSPPPINHP